MVLPVFRKQALKLNKQTGPVMQFMKDLTNGPIMVVHTLTLPYVWQVVDAQ